MAFTASFIVTATPRAPVAQARPLAAAQSTDFARLLNDANHSTAVGAKIAGIASLVSLKPEGATPRPAQAAPPTSASATGKTVAEVTSPEPAGIAALADISPIPSVPQQTTVQHLTAQGPTTSEAQLAVSVAPADTQHGKTPAQHMEMAAPHTAAVQPQTAAPSAAPQVAALAGMSASSSAGTLRASGFPSRIESDPSLAEPVSSAPAAQGEAAAQAGGTTTPFAATPTDAAPQHHQPTASTRRQFAAPADAAGLPAHVPAPAQSQGAAMASAAQAKNTSASPPAEASSGTIAAMAPAPSTAQNDTSQAETSAADVPVDTGASSRDPAASHATRRHGLVAEAPQAAPSAPGPGTLQPAFGSSPNGATAAPPPAAKTATAQIAISEPAALQTAEPSAAVQTAAEAETGRHPPQIAAGPLAATAGASNAAPALQPPVGASGQAQPADPEDLAGSEEAAIDPDSTPPLIQATPHARAPFPSAPSTGQTGAPDAAPGSSQASAQAPSAPSASPAETSIQPLPPSDAKPTAVPASTGASQRTASRTTTSPAGATTDSVRLQATGVGADPRPVQADQAAQNLASPAPLSAFAPPASHTIAPDAASAQNPAPPQANASPLHSAQGAPDPAKPTGKPAAGPNDTPVAASPAPLSAPDAGAAPAQQQPADAAPLPTSGTVAAATSAAPTGQPAAQAAEAAANPPANQIAQAVASLHVGADGTSHTTIKLDPAELGQVQIRISRAQDGTSSVSVAVERADTLATLQNDLGHLHQALDRAGVPEQRSVSLHLAGADQPGSQTLGNNTGGMPQGGSQQGARQDRQPAATAHASGLAPVTMEPASAPDSVASVQNTGVNITA